MNQTVLRNLAPNWLRPIHFGRVAGLLLLFHVFVVTSLSAQEPVSAVQATLPNVLSSSIEQQEEQAFRIAVATIEPSIVRIETVGGLDQVEDLLLGRGPTTGVIVAADGWIISSAFNFVAQPSAIVVRLPDGRPMPAKLVATDKARAISLLNVDAGGLPVPQGVPKQEIQIAQWALACGRTLNPDTPSVSIGIVSALGRVWGRAIQTDAKVSPVNYGGPLIDIQGRVIGILVPLSPDETTAVSGVEWYDGGIGFAVPWVDILSNLPRLQTGEDLLPGLMGATFQDASLTSTRIVVDRVRFGSPADKAGLKSGDVIAKADNQPTERVSQLRHVLGPKSAGDSLQLEIVRDSQTLPMTVTLVGELQPYQQPYLGLVPQRTPASPMRVRLVLPNSPAAMSGLEPQDEIQQLNGEPVTSTGDFAEQISRLQIGAKVTLLVRRGTEALSREVTLTTQPQMVPADVSAELWIPTPPAMAAPAVEAPLIQEQAPAEVNPTYAPAVVVPTLPKTGRISETLPGFDRDYWMYLPEGSDQQRSLALLVWLHPANDTMEAELIERWKGLCERRGIAIVAPRSQRLEGWAPGDAEFIEACVKAVQERAVIDPRRIVVHGHGSSNGMAWSLALRQPKRYRGVMSTQGQFPQPLPDHEPDSRQQFYLQTSAENSSSTKLKKAVEAARKAGYSVIWQASGPAQEYPAAETIEEMGRWIELLDRI